MPRYLQCGLAKTTIQAILCAGLGLGMMGLQLASVFAQTNFGISSASTGSARNALARVYASNNNNAGVLPNGMIAITFPTQITVNDQVQVLMPDYRILRLQSGSYRIEDGQVYADPALLQSIGYPVSEEMLMASRSAQKAQESQTLQILEAPQTMAMMGNNFQVEALQTRTQQAPPLPSIQRKVLGFIPQAGTAFGYGDPDPTYGTLGLRVTEYECQTQKTLSVTRLAGDIAFDSNQATIKPAFLPELNALASQMLAQSQASFTITGHTDSRGSVEYNQALSESRAKTIMEYLVNKGVPRDKIRATGAGENRPIASNDTEKGRTENRRVEVISNGGMANTTNNCSRTQVIGASDDQRSQTLSVIPKQPIQPVSMPQFNGNAFLEADYAMQNTFITGSTGFSSGLAAVPLSTIAPITASSNFMPNASVPTSASTAGNTATTNQSYRLMNETQNTENNPLSRFNALGNAIADVPPVVWSVAAVATVVVGYLVFADGNSNN